MKVQFDPCSIGGLDKDWQNHRDPSVRGAGRTPDLRASHLAEPRPQGVAFEPIGCRDRRAYGTKPKRKDTKSEHGPFLPLFALLAFLGVPCCTGGFALNLAAPAIPLDETSSGREKIFVFYVPNGTEIRPTCCRHQIGNQLAHAPIRKEVLATP